MILATLFVALTCSGAVRAAEPRSGWLLDSRLGAGVATVAYDETEYPIADFEAFALAGGLRFGGFIGPHVAFGADVAVTWGAGVGELRVHDPLFFQTSGYPTSATYGHIAPFGVFLELYPWRQSGLFLGVSGGVGIMQLPQFGSGDGDGGPMARYALELGYDLDPASKEGPAIYLRFERWRGAELSIAEEHPDGIVSSQVLAGLCWRIELSGDR